MKNQGKLKPEYLAPIDMAITKEKFKALITEKIGDIDFIEKDKDGVIVAKPSQQKNK